MKLLRNASGLALAVIVSGTAASAYTLQQASKPAEVPPASYRSDVYVDSRGCAYVRANIGSTVNWVPRLSSDRKTVICGLTPTAKATGMASTRPPAPPAPPPPAAVPTTPAPTTLAGATPPAAASPVAAPKPASPSPISRTMKVTCPTDGSAARVRIGSDTVSVQCAPGQTTAKSYIIQHGNGERTRLVASPAPAPAPETVARVPATPMPTASNARVLIGGVAPGTASAAGGYGFGRGFGVSSGPGVADPVPSPGQAVRRAPATTTPSGAAPVGSYGGAPVPDAERVVIPSGYRSAWDDGRLNPNRGPQSASGDQQMAAKWDITKVPMEAVNPVPARGLIAQPDTGGFRLFSKSPSAVPAAVAQSPAAPALTKRYVQVGAFNVAANAERAAARLQALGLPGRVVQTRSGRTVVVAGPYDNASALRNALASARSGGFSDAFLRN